MSMEREKLVDAAAEADRRFKYANDVYADALTERRKAARERNDAYNDLFSADYDAQGETITEGAR